MEAEEVEREGEEEQCSLYCWRNQTNETNQEEMRGTTHCLEGEAKEGRRIKTRSEDRGGEKEMGGV